MKISDLLIESQKQQLDELTAADVGKGVGKVAKGIGAVAGGVAGIPGAVKKGFQAGKQTVAGAGDQEQPQAQAAQTQQEPAQQPAAKPGLMGKLKQAAGDFKKGFQQGSGAAQEPAADTQQPTAEPAATPAAPAKKEPAQGGTDIAAIKQELNSFLQTYKQDIAMQNKNWTNVLPRLNSLEKQVSDLATAKGSAAPNVEKKTKAPSQKQIDADRERVMGMTSDSVIRTGRAVTESFQLFRKK